MLLGGDAVCVNIVHNQGIEIILRKGALKFYVIEPYYSVYIYAILNIEHTYF